MNWTSTTAYSGTYSGYGYRDSASDCYRMARDFVEEEPKKTIIVEVTVEGKI